MSNSGPSIMLSRPSMRTLPSAYLMSKTKDSPQRASVKINITQPHNSSSTMAKMGSNMPQDIAEVPLTRTKMVKLRTGRLRQQTQMHQPSSSTTSSEKSHVQ